MSVSGLDAAQFYDERWAEFRYANRLKCIRASSILDLLTRTREVEPRILDIGSGAGWMSNILSMFGPTTGLELSPKAVATASARYPHAAFVAGDVRGFPCDKPYDIVVAQEVLEHFERHQEFIEAAWRLIRPGGWLILTTPNAATLAAMPESVRRSFQNQPVENPLTMRQLRDVVSTRFEARWARSIVPGFGSNGLAYRVANSRQIWAVWDRCWGDGAAGRLACRLGFGLHLAMLARKTG